jgi:hypothetical protein
VFVRSGFGAMLEGRQQSPLSLSGRAFSVEAGLTIPGEASFALELGVRGRVLEPEPSLKRLAAVRTLSLTGGARARIGVLPLELGLVPILTGGLEISTTHDVYVPDRTSPDTRLSLGPHFGAGFEKRLFEHAVLSMLLMSRAEIVPVTLELGFVLELRVE